MLGYDPNQWIIIGLIFVLGLLVGGFLFSGGGRKWKHRYNAEVDRRREIEASHAEAQKEWREKESLHAAALRDAQRNRAAPVAAGAATAAAVEAERKPGLIDRLTGRDRDHDGIPDRDERPVVRDGDDGRPGFIDRVTGRDRDHDGIPDRDEGFIDRDRDGIDDRRER
ncbi:hypothetical protein ABDK56_00405 [Sphingomonas sp. ASV193]|uniref:hypothetical protein n=1 Tax=Sphingomonas sp. ASV193 TaxID=3144405 RepID=UPI0032E85757